jgi:hypothetical protein
VDNRPRNLIPDAEAIRERLAQNYEEARLLRRQLRISEDAAIEAHNRSSQRKTSRYCQGGEPSRGE